MKSSEAKRAQRERRGIPHAPHATPSLPLRRSSTICGVHPKTENKFERAARAHERQRELVPRGKKKKVTLAPNDERCLPRLLLNIAKTFLGMPGLQQIPPIFHYRDPLSPPPPHPYPYLRLAHSDKLRNVSLYPGLTQGKYKRLERVGKRKAPAEDKCDKVYKT